MTEQLRMSPNLVRFAGVSQFLSYCAGQHKIAYENRIDTSARQDSVAAVDYLYKFEESLSTQERKKYNLLCEAIIELFNTQIMAHKRLPGVESCALNT